MIKIIIITRFMMYNRSLHTSRVKQILAALACVFTMNATAAATKPIIMGYWENWSTYQNFPIPHNAKGSTNAVLRDQMTGITALAYAFLEIDANGSLIFSDSWSDLNPDSEQDKQFCSFSPAACTNYPQNAGLGNFTAFTQTPVEHHVVSVGGAGHDAAWEHAFANPDQFVASLVKLVEIYRIDWLDIDYEPVGGVPPQHIKGFIELTNRIKRALPSLVISYAIPANSDSIDHFGAENWQQLAKNLTYISIMGYDIHGVFDTSNPYTALHSPLVTSDKSYSIESAIHALNRAGIKNKAIILGMPMYGRAVGGVSVSGLGQTFTQAVRGDLDEATCSLNMHASNACGGMIQYKSLVDQAYTAVPALFNQQLSGVYAYNADKQLFVSYDDPASAAVKAQYAMDKQLAGVMFWALRFDMPVGDTRSILAAVDKVYGIKPSMGAEDVGMKLQLTNNDPNNAVSITLVTNQKSNWYAFPALSPKNQTNSDVTYTDINSASVKALMKQNSILVLLTPTHGEQVWCQGSLDFTTSTYHHIQVYYDYPQPSCAIT
jgi:chitinase